MLERQGYVRASLRTVAILLMALCAVTAYASAKWCVKPTGSGTRDAMWAAIQPLLPEMRKLAGGRDFAIISTPKVGTLADQSDIYRESYRRSYITSWLDAEASDEKKYVNDPDLAPFIGTQEPELEAEVDRVMKATQNKYSRAFVRIAVRHAADIAKKATAKIVSSAGANGDADYIDELSSGKRVDFTYVYSTSDHFRKLVTLDGTERGATLESGDDELKGFYSGGVQEYLKGVDYVFIDNLTPGLSSPLEGPSRALIRLPAMKNGAYADIIGLVHGIDKKRYKAFSLLPETESAAKPWGLDEHLTRSYASAGRKVAKELKRGGIDRGSWSSAATLKDAIEKAVVDGRRPVLIGESADNGRVHLAGLNEVFDPSVLSPEARKATMFLFCNSSESEATRAGFAVEGKIYVNTVAQLIGTLATEPTVENSRKQIKTTDDWLQSLVDALTSTTTENGSKVVNVYRFQGRSQPPVPGPTNATDNSIPTPLGGDDVPYQLFLYGAFGGLCSEFFRWRALMSRPRGKQYLAPLYFGLSVVFVLLAGGVGFVFGRLAPSALLQTVAAFIAGAGLEEVIKRASRLKAPNVPFDKRGIKASLHEFLGG